MVGLLARMGAFVAGTHKIALLMVLQFVRFVYRKTHDRACLLYSNQTYEYFCVKTSKMMASVFEIEMRKKNREQ